MSSNLRIMSFNVRGALYDDGENHWKRRGSLNVRTILRQAPDLIGFQEVHPGNLDVYQEQLQGFSWFQGPPYNDEEPFQYPAIFWNDERFRLVETGGFWISDTPDRHSGAWETACIRSVAWVRLVWLETGIVFIHLNTHLDHVSKEARNQGARLITQRLDAIARRETPVLITGDFNCMPASSCYRIFFEAGFIDTYLSNRPHPRAWTFHNFKGENFKPDKKGKDRMDWILARNWPDGCHVEQCSIVREAEPPLFPSDHYPVVADLCCE